MKDTITIPIKLLNSLKISNNLVIHLRNIAKDCKDADEFYKKAVDLLEVNIKLEEKLKNK